MSQADAEALRNAMKDLVPMNLHSLKFVLIEQIPNVNK